MRRFQVVSREGLDGRLDFLRQAAPQSWLELRSFRGDVLRLTSDDPGTTADVESFLLGRTR